ncbi:MAG: type II secretion system F family protein [Porphyrobacter sp.]|nr:type II secretion system F family protein [Porphyrobacter sp.]
MINLLLTNPVLRMIVLLVLFALFTFAFSRFLQFALARLDLRRQVRDIGTQIRALKTANGSIQNRDESAWAQLAQALEKAGLNLVDTKGDKLHERMFAAGFREPSAPKIFTMVRLGMVFILPGTYLLLTALSGEEASLLELYAISSGLAALGLYIPNLFVQARIDRRQEAIELGFPDCLDLMLVCVEAGLGLESAMNRVGREMMRSHPEIAELLSTTTLQMRAGAPREEALRTLGTLSGVNHVRSFAALLIQSDRMGTSLGDSLRIYSTEMREKRRMRAEEKAHRIPVLISIPLVVFMLPVMISVLMLPGAIRIMQAFS